MAINPLDAMKVFGLTDVLLTPIHKLIERILPQYLQENLHDEGVRTRIVQAVDAALLAEQPAAALVPSEVRQRIIHGLLSVVLDQIVLGAPR